MIWAVAGLRHDYEDYVMREPIEAEEWAPVRRLNLNLLYPLDAILNAPSLTEAGRRVYLSQSAMSHALRRLREHFKDELVNYTSGRQNLTPLGDALRPEIRRVMREVEHAFDFSLEFDPSTSTREVVIAASETVEHTFLATLLRKLTSEAPDVVLNMLPLNLTAPDSALARGADIIILPDFASNPRYEKRLLFYETLACMVRADHPILGPDGAIHPDDYAAGRHIAALADNTIAAPADAEGEALLASRRISVRTSLQAAVPSFVLQSDLIATGSSSLFQSYGAMMPLMVTSAPFRAQEVPIVFQWSPHRRNDPMMRWLIARLETSVPEHLQIGSDDRAAPQSEVGL
jgi:LysR family transcriptional regulator, nod-box dependent transcriptional activator